MKRTLLLSLLVAVVLVVAGAVWMFWPIYAFQRVDGQPHVRIGDIRQVRLVMKDGIPFPPADVLKLSAGR